MKIHGQRAQLFVVLKEKFIVKQRQGRKKSRKRYVITEFSSFFSGKYFHRCHEHFLPPYCVVVVASQCWDFLFSEKFYFMKENKAKKSSTSQKSSICWEMATSENRREWKSEKRKINKVIPFRPSSCAIFVNNLSFYERHRNPRLRRSEPLTVKIAKCICQHGEFRACVYAKRMIKKAT